jgi:membrane-associated phospholipid phosphatase
VTLTVRAPSEPEEPDAPTRHRGAQITGALIALAVFGIVVEQVMTNGWMVHLDRRFARYYSHNRAGRVRSLRHLVGDGRVVSVAKFFAPFGEAGLLLVLAAIVAVVLYGRSRRREAAFLMTAVVGGMILNLVTRTIIGRVRPDLPIPGFVVSRDGLPSGHAMDATVCYGALLVVAWSALKGWQRVVATVGAFGLALAVSWSRVITLAHYFSDVVAGLALGLAWLLAMSAAFSLPRRERVPATT